MAVKFLITLLPVIGLVQVGMQSDGGSLHLCPAALASASMISWGLADLAGRGSLRTFAMTATVAGLAACLVLTMRQVTYWRNSKALYEHALAVTQGNIIAHGNLGSVLQDEVRT